MVRDNANFFVLFRQDERNLKLIYNDHVNTDMDFLKFRTICSTCWHTDKYGFLVIDKDSDINNGRYRRGFDCYINITTDGAENKVSPSTRKTSTIQKNTSDNFILYDI